MKPIASLNVGSLFLLNCELWRKLADNVYRCRVVRVVKRGKIYFYSEDKIRISKDTMVMPVKYE